MKRVFQSRSSRAGLMALLATLAVSAASGAQADPMHHNVAMQHGPAQWGHHQMPPQMHHQHGPAQFPVHRNFQPHHYDQHHRAAWQPGHMAHHPGHFRPVQAAHFPQHRYVSHPHVSYANQYTPQPPHHSYQWNPGAQSWQNQP